MSSEGQLGHRKYVTAALVVEIRANFGHELQQIDRPLERIDECCAEQE